MDGSERDSSGLPGARKAPPGESHLESGAWGVAPGEQPCGRQGARLRPEGQSRYLPVGVAAVRTR